MTRVAVVLSLAAGLAWPSLATAQTKTAGGTARASASSGTMDYRSNLGLGGGSIMYEGASQTVFSAVTSWLLTDKLLFDLGLDVLIVDDEAVVGSVGLGYAVLENPSSSLFVVGGIAPSYFKSTSIPDAEGEFSLADAGYGKLGFVWHPTGATMAPLARPDSDERIGFGLFGDFGIRFPFGEGDSVSFFRLGVAMTRFKL